MELALDCIELSDLPIPKVSLEKALGAAYETTIHIPARLYDKFKKFKNLIVYKQPSENYFGLNVKNIVAIREVTFEDNLNCNWKSVSGKSDCLKVEKPCHNISSLPNQNNSINHIVGGNDSRFKNVHIGKNKTIIYFHGMNPHGLKFTEVPEEIEKYCINHNYSYGFYLRGNDKDVDIEKLEIHEPGAEDEDVYDLDAELPLFKEAFESTFPTTDKVYFLGHSYGANFAKYFAKEYGRSISLDGSDLYTAVPYFIGLYLNEDVKAEDIEWNEKSYVYKGINYYGNNEAGLWTYYCDVMWKCREDDANNTVIDYAANVEAPEEVKLTKVDNKYYSNYYQLHYGKEYSHTLHMIPEVVNTIFETFIDEAPTADKVSSNYFKRRKRLYGGEDENDTLIIDVDIPDREWKGFDVVKVNANDKSTYEEHISKRGFMWKPFFCKFENYDKYNKLGFNNTLTFLFTDKDTDIDAEPGNHRNVTVIETTDVAKVVNVYGKNARQYFRVNNPYEFVIKRFFNIYDNELLVGPSHCLHMFYIDRLLGDEYYVLDDCLKYYCKNRKIMLTSDDVKCLGVGSFNVALRINDDVLRIHINYETPFDYEGAEILMKEKDTGFVPVKEVHDGCTVVAACETIKDVDNDKAKAMCDKLRKFFAKYKDLGYVDYHWGNIMEYNNMYVITDIDLNMVSPEYFLSYPKVKLDDVLNSEQSTGWNPKLYVTLLEAYAIPVTTYNLTMVALNLFEAVDYNRLFTLTKELADTVMSMETYDK